MQSKLKKILVSIGSSILIFLIPFEVENIIGYLYEEKPIYSTHLGVIITLVPSVFLGIFAFLGFYLSLE